STGMALKRCAARACFELVVGLTQRTLGIQADTARLVHQHEQRIAERLAVLSLTPALQGDAGIERCLLRRLVPQADTPGALLHVFGLGQRRQPLWDVAEERVHLGAALLL